MERQWTNISFSESSPRSQQLCSQPDWEEAKQVAEALSGDASVLEQAPADPASLASEGGAADAAAADIIVVLGTDEQLR